MGRLIRDVESLLLGSSNGGQSGEFKRIYSNFNDYLVKYIGLIRVMNENVLF